MQLLSTSDLVLQHPDFGIGIMNNLIHRGAQAAVPLGQVFENMLLVRPMMWSVGSLSQRVIR